MITVCTNSPIPSFQSLYDQVLAHMTFPPPELSIPALPGLKNPIYAGFSNINMEIVQLVQELQNYQLQITLMAVFEPLVAFLGGALENILPKIPGTDLTLIDLLACDPDTIYAAIAEAIAIHGIGIFPFVPNPMFSGLSIPAIEAVNVIKMVTRGYYVLLLNALLSLINQVADILEIGGLSGIPAIPTLSQVQAAILAAFPGFTSLTALIASGIGIQTLFSAISFPGLPTMLMPSPLIPGFSSYEAEFQEALAILYGNLTTVPLNIILDFVQNALGMLGFSFPTICISF